MNAFSKQADELMEQSIELDRNAKPGDIYLDPVWGIVQVPHRDLDLMPTEEQ